VSNIAKSVHTEQHTRVDTQVASNSREVISRILLQHELITAEDLQRCQRISGKLDSSITFFLLLKKMELIDEEVFLDALREHAYCLPYGTLLVELGYIKPNELRQILLIQNQEETQTKLGELLIDNQLLKESDSTRILACHMGLRSGEPTLPDCEQALLMKSPLKTMLELEFFPIRSVDDVIHVAFVDPLNQMSRTEAARIFATEIVPVLTSRTTLKRLIALIHRYKKTSEDSTVESEDPLGVPAQVYGILRAAIQLGASDIHIEPLENRVRVRHRIDGVLREFSEIDKINYPGIVSRMKIESGADIAERRVHQDGRIRFTDRSTGIETDLRASFYVTIHGECVVMRILNRSDSLPRLDDMNIPPLTLTRFRQQALEIPSGVVVVTGPTGSGKTTTMYSCVSELNNDTTSIITAEEPVEYTIDGISQCSLDPKIGRSFDESLRHIVRQDPDIIVLGEVRDAYSAGCAIQAALTGHKVLTTFHTEDSVGGLLRLINMDIEAFLIASTVTCIVAQRLIRKICANCGEDAETDYKTLKVLEWRIEDLGDIQFRKGKGCPECQFTGYKGRVIIFEPLILNKTIRDSILLGATASELRRVSLETASLVTLLEDGLLKAATGLTTLSEVRRALPRAAPPRDLSDLRRLTGIQI